MAFLAILVVGGRPSWQKGRLLYLWQQNPKPSTGLTRLLGILSLSQYTLVLWGRAQIKRLWYHPLSIIPSTQLEAICVNY